MIHPRECSHKFKKKCKSVNLMTYFKFECSLNDLFCVFTAYVLKSIVCVNKKAILSQFQDQMIRFTSRSLKRNKHI